MSYFLDMNNLDLTSGQTLMILELSVAFLGSKKCHLFKILIISREWAENFEIVNLLPIQLLKKLRLTF